MDEERFEYLINGFCDGALAVAESRELACWLEGSDEARRAFVRTMDVHQLLREWFAVAPAPVTAEAETSWAQAGTVAVEERPSSPYLRELLHRYVTGVLEPMEAEALQVLMRDDAHARAELRRVCEALGRPVPETELGKAKTAVVVAVPGPRRRTPVGRPSSLRLEPAPRPGEARRALRGARARLLAAACVVALTGGLLWLWIAASSLPASRVATYEEEEAGRRQEVQRRLDELEREAGALRAAQGAEGQRAMPTPGPAEGTQEKTQAQEVQAARPVEREKPGRRQDAEELARLLELRRQALQAELAGLKPKRQAEPDEESEEPPAKADGAIAPSVRAAPEVGRVIFVETGARGAVLVRGKEDQTTRTRLTAGTALRAGDHIEVERPGEQVFAAVELQGGSTLDLAGGTAVQILGSDAVRLDCGQVYASVAVPVPTGQEPEYAAPFSLQTPAARYLAQQARMEVFASPPLSAPALTRSRLDSGKVHLFNAKGHVMGRPGQEVTARAGMAPVRAGEFSGPIWRGRDLPYPGLPFGFGNPLIWEDENPTAWFSAEYALAVAQSGVLNLRGLHVTQGGDQRGYLQKLKQAMRALAPGLRNAPEPMLGAARSLQRPASGRPEDTRPEDSPAARQIVAEARKARPDRPLLVASAFSMTDLASAWLLDRNCADTVIVLKDLSGKADGDWIIDPWAGVLVLSHFRCVILPAAVPLTVDLPRLVLAPDPRWRSLARKATSSDSDFPTLALATMPGFVQASERASVVFDANDDFQYRPHPAGRIWVVKRADWQLMTDEFHRTFLDSEGSRQGGSGQ